MNRHRLPWATAFRIGLSIKKPLRFFFTVLLSTVAFVMTGLALIVAFYDEDRAKVQTYVQFTDGFYMYPTESSFQFEDINAMRSEISLSMGAIGSISRIIPNEIAEPDTLASYAHRVHVHLEPQASRLAFFPPEIIEAQGISLLAGEEIHTEGDIILPSCMAYVLLVSKMEEDIDSIIGEEVSFSFADEQVKLKVVGVYDNSVCSSNENSMGPCNSSEPYAGAVFVSENLFYQFSDSIDIISFAGDHNTASGERLIKFLNANSGQVQADAFLGVEMYRNDIINLSRGLGIAGGILAGFSILLTFQFVLISIEGKRQMIGVLRALGGKGRDIIKIFLIESGFLGLITALCALILMAVLLPSLNAIFTVVFNAKIALLTYVPLPFILVFFISITAALLSALFPVMRESRRLPVEVIKFAVE